MSDGFLLDTNVLSELMREQPHESVLAWFAEQSTRAMFTSVITQAEILTGIALLPGGRRRTALADAAEQMFALDFERRCLAFDSQAAKNYALIVASRTRQGKPITTEDGQIAAIALTHDLVVATRNTKDFDQIQGMAIANPWQAASSH